MKRTIATVMAGLMAAGAAYAEPADDTLVLNEDVEMVTRTSAPAHLQDVMDEVWSGWHFRGVETRAMQADDFDNPGMIFVEQAEEAWKVPGWPATSGHEDRLAEQSRSRGRAFRCQLGRLQNEPQEYIRWHCTLGRSVPQELQ